MSICVCANCRNPWGAPGSPAICPHCGEASFAIAVQMGSQTMSAVMKKRWQDPEYRAKQSAAQSAARKKLWQNPEYRARMSAARTDKQHTTETKAKISAALTQVREGRNSRGHFVKGNVPWNKKGAGGFEPPTP